ncbi:MAG TPA: DUF6531 domain-containing protein, partial [Fimbriimonadaceae bacterium]|nr:DUF6531 domain-containing protein [Fimbriimonadaceae bacterium]
MNNRTPQFRLVCLALTALMAVSATSSGITALIESASGVTASWMRHWQNRPIAVAPAKDAPGYDRASRGGLWPRALRDLHVLNRVEQGRIYADETMASLLLQSQGGSEGGGSGAPGESGAPAGAGGMVNTLNGNRMSTYPLVDWPSRGASGVEFTLVHNSLSTYSHELGVGWTHSYDVSVTYGNDLATIRYEDGLEVPYTRAADQGSTWTFTRPAGYFSVLTRAGANGNWTLKNKRNETYRFNPDGWLIEVEDRFGNKVTVARNSSNKVTSVTCPSGRVLTFSYTNGRITGLTDPMSRSWSISYTGGNDLDKITYPTIGGSTPQRDFDYNGSSDITQETDLRGKAWTYTYSNGKLLTAKTPLNEETSYSYGTNLTTITLPGGQTQEHQYSNGLLASKKDGTNHTVQFQDYTTDRQVTKIVDQRGKIWGYTFDSNGNLVKMRTPLNTGTSHEWAYTYNANHDVVSIIDPLGNETEIEYNGLKPWRVFDPLVRQQAEFTFNSSGNLTSVVDANTKTWSFTVDSHGNTTHSSTPLANTTSVYQYNTLGRLTHVTEPLGQVSHTEYDNWMRPLRFVHPGGADVELTYDHEDNVLTVTDERNKTGSYLYDDAGRVTRFTNARGDIEDYTYNTNGWLWKVKNGRNVERVYTYNNRGEVTNLVHPGQSDEKWSYLPTGQLDIYDNSLFTVDHNYDDAGRLTLVDYPAGTTDTSFTYDNADRPKTMVRGSETTEWFYNAASELTKFESPEGKIEYEYRVDGLRSKMIRQTTHVTEYSYDDAGRLTSLKNPLNEITSFLYDRNSRLSRKTLHNGTDVVYGYDNRSRPTSINMEEDGEAIIWQSLGYDAASNITSHTINLVTTNYTYDDINQLLSEARTGHNTSYTYDGNGNRTQRVINGVTETYSYDNGDKLTSVTWTGGSKTYGYDNAGRLTSVTTGG